MTPLPAFWSVHDVSPSTFARSRALVERLERSGIRRLTILVVPEGHWTPDSLEQLRAWADAGHELAAHGWNHRSPAPRTLSHRLHSLILSRDTAEHLGRSRAEVAAIVARSAAWFAANNLPPPCFYVPPAWARGPLSDATLLRNGFTHIETLDGIRDLGARRSRILPLVGFEADTRFRAVVVGASNAANLALARLTGRPLRIGIHPNDEALLLGHALDRWLARRTEPLLPTRRAAVNRGEPALGAGRSTDPAPS